MLIKLRDPVERAGPPVGFMRARESETGRRMVAEGPSRWFESDALLERLADLGADTAVIDVDDEVPARVAELLAGRRHAGRRVL